MSPLPLDLQFRAPTRDDALAVTDLVIACDVAELHTVEEDRRFIANVILKECEVTIAVVGNTIVAFLARDKAEVRLLHTHPDFLGEGAGSLLLEAAKGAADGVLELWCFQANMRARRFYAARGFRPIRFTDGEGNEERLPDVRYRWRRRPTGS